MRTLAESHSESVRFCEHRAIRCLAGDLATNHVGLMEERYPWWRVWEVVKFPWHKADHVVTGWALGRYPFYVSIRLNPSVKAVKGVMAGVACSSATPEPPPEMPVLSELKSARRLVAEARQVSGIVTPPHGWRGAIRAYHRLP
jgi:hypothetical protein